MRFYHHLITLVFALSLTGYSQSTESFAIKPGQSVYIVAVKGYCGVERAIAYANGQLIVSPVPLLGLGDRTGKSQKMLTRFEPLPDAGKVIQETFTKDKTFKVVETLEQADFVFHVCGSFTADVLPPEWQRSQIPAQLVVARAQVIPAAAYAQFVAGSADKLTMWKAMTPDAERPLKNEKPDEKKKKEPPQAGPYPIWNGAAMTPEVTTPKLDYLVKYFLQDYPQIAAFGLSGKAPGATSAQATNQPVNESQEKRRPVLTNKQDAKEIEEKPTTPKPEQDDIIKIDTALIYVPVRVVDKDGKYVPDLTPKDFKIYEDGVEQEIEHFSAVDDPFNVVLLLDTSGSTRFKIEDIQDAAVTFTEQLRPQDRVMVVSFDQKVWVEAEFTNDRINLLKAILRTRTGSSTSVYDALDLVLTERLNQIQGRKAIVLFSDGVDTSSHLATLQSTMERIEESNSILYSVHYDTQDVVVTNAPRPPNMIMPGSTKEDYQRAEKYMQELAQRSGGRFYEAATLGDAKEAFASIAEELRRQYGLGYYSKNDQRDGAFRKIRVQGAKANWAVRSRLGYRAPKK